MAIKKAFRVIVSKCTEAGDRVYERLLDTTVSRYDEAVRASEIDRVLGQAVIIRPNYNELDDNGNDFFREWRSFNGEPLYEVRFNIP